MRARALRYRGEPRESCFGIGVRTRPSRDVHSAAFTTPAAAQFWLEWKRHGKALPLATTGILLLIVAPAPFVAPVSGEAAILATFWILATPLLISFVLGKGLGKADLWSSDPAVPLFMATKPVSPDTRVSAKLRMAAAAAVLSWALIGAVVPLWFWLWCDYEVITRELLSVCAALIIAAVLLTFRFLAGSIYIGLSGQRFAINLAACGVFLALFGTLAAILAVSQRQAPLDFFEPAQWMAWTLAGVFALKLCAACRVTTQAIRARCLMRRTALRYGWFWLITTLLLLAPLWLFAPAKGEWKWLLSALALFIVPLFRTAVAPFAVAYSDRG